jgi:hypothetical protein
MNDALMQAVELVRRNPEIALVSAAGAYLLLLLLVVVVLVRFAKIAGKQRRLLRGADGESLEQMLLEHADGAEEVRTQIARAAKSGEENAEALRLCLQKIGLVRYDAFPDVGGEQSFSFALLDGSGSGLVLTGLYSRNDMRVYAKPVIGGVSPHALTEEERQAITGARTGGPVTEEAGGRTAGTARRR